VASAISIQNVTKKFKLHQQKAKSLKERFILAGRNPSVDFLALDDVSFEVPAGATMGLLGHNGSGKSTLLKCISGTLRPTSGDIEVRGRMAALLELGAGFHPDLTGRENIYLNGSILGFSRVEIDRIFDDIVEFAELGDFIENQVKHYSSGMYARLGFAVSVNVDPEILLIDEVLSVGDEAFQRKCLDRIATFQKEGRTILVVTHAADLVRQICDEVAVLDSGKLVTVGEPGDAVRIYRDTLAMRGQTPPTELLTGPHATRGGVVLSELHITGPDPDNHTIRTGDPLVVEVQVDVEEEVPDLVVAFSIHDQNGVMVHGTNTDVLESPVDPSAGTRVVRFEIDRLPLLDGTFAVTIGSHSYDGMLLYHQLQHVERFHVRSGRRAAGVAALDVRASSRPGRLG
jgi:ABC-type polysaccharide/polyol phosphate transport system ATPase subunit